MKNFTLIPMKFQSDFGSQLMKKMSFEGSGKMAYMIGTLFTPSCKHIKVVMEILRKQQTESPGV